MNMTKFLNILDQTNSLFRTTPVKLLATNSIYNMKDNVYASHTLNEQAYLISAFCYVSNRFEQSHISVPF